MKKTISIVNRSASVEEITKRLMPVFEEQRTELVLLFGSAASGTMHKRSDIDLAFLFEGPVDILALTNKVIQLLRTDNVDVVDLRHAPPLLRYLVAKNGRVLYERRQGLFNVFYSLAFRMYVDSRKLREAQRAAMSQYLAVRGLS
jgi:predicted nucleotidyltransferase